MPRRSAYASEEERRQARNRRQREKYATDEAYRKRRLAHRVAWEQGKRAGGLVESREEAMDRLSGVERGE